MIAVILVGILLAIALPVLMVGLGLPMGVLAARWRGRWPPPPRCCCWTNRFRRWT